MRLFEVQTKLTSYVYPLVKIVLSLLAIAFGVSRNSFLHISGQLGNVFMTILCLILALTSILTMYISIGELCYVYSNRKDKRCTCNEVQFMSVREIVEILSQSDIMEIDVCDNGTIVRIGVSAECRYSSSVFENRVYYISDQEYTTIDLFLEAISKMFSDGNVPVVAVDGLRKR